MNETIRTVPETATVKIPKQTPRKETRTWEMYDILSLRISQLFSLVKHEISMLEQNVRQGICIQ